jgi:hypothetical protein
VTRVVRDLVATRLACLCLVDQRPRGLPFDDHLVRAALVVDLVLARALAETDDAVELDEGLAAELGVAAVASRVAAAGSLDGWIERGGMGFADWAEQLVDSGVWSPRPRSVRYPVRQRYQDTAARRTQADRALGRRPSTDGASPATLAVLALGSVSGLFGEPRPPRPWLVPAMGEPGWAGRLAVDKLIEAGTRMRITATTVG